jgi:hypothetical protein
VKKYGKEDKKSWVKIGESLKKKRTEHQVKNRYKALMAKYIKENKVAKFNNFDEEKQAIDNIVEQLDKELLNKKTNH